MVRKYSPAALAAIGALALAGVLPPRNRGLIMLAAPVMIKNSRLAWFPIKAVLTISPLTSPA